MAIAILAGTDTSCSAGPFAHGWVLLGLAIYPHAGHLLFGRFDIRRLRGRTMLFVDGLFAGVVIAALDFQTVPSTILGAILAFNWMVIGGPSLVVRGALALLAGVAGMAALSAPPIRSIPACTTQDWLAATFLVAYLLIVAAVIHRLVQELGEHQQELQTESDAARHAQAMAEGALIAALPAGTAHRMIDSGILATEDFPDATVLMFSLETGTARTPSLALLAEVLQAADLILARHGFDLLKTFGRRALAIGRTTSPDNALAAFREIDAFFANHPPANLSPGEHLRVRAAIASGYVRLGPVQAERLNLDMTGEAADTLTGLGKILDADPAARFIVAPAAGKRLPETAGLVFFPGDDRIPPHCRPADGKTAS